MPPFYYSVSPSCIFAFAFFYLSRFHYLHYRLDLFRVLIDSLHCLRLLLLISAPVLVYTRSNNQISLKCISSWVEARRWQSAQKSRAINTATVGSVSKTARQPSGVIRIAGDDAVNTAQLERDVSSLAQSMATASSNALPRLACSAAPKVKTATWLAKLRIAVSRYTGHTIQIPVSWNTMSSDKYLFARKQKISRSWQPFWK